MKAKETYLKGKSVFIVSLIVVGVTTLTVYLSGVNYNRTVTSNLYLSLGLIGVFLFFFMTYGLYKGVGLIDNFPKYKDLKSRNLTSSSLELNELPDVDTGGGIGGILVSILLWIVMTAVLFVFLIVFQTVFYFSLFIILTMLYWVFFRALRFVFNKSSETKGNLGLSVMYSIGYTLLFTGWIFGIVYLSAIVK
jgi:hypothetical protein